MSGPPTLFSRARGVLRVFFPLLYAFVLFGTALPATLGIPPDWTAWLYFGGVVAFYATPGMLEYPVTTVGRARRVDTEPVESGDERHCTVCGAAIEDGEHREYAEQWVLFGVPLKNVDWGENDYCGVCASSPVDLEDDGIVPLAEDVGHLDAGRTDAAREDAVERERELE